MKTFTKENLFGILKGTHKFNATSWIIGMAAIMPTDSSGFKARVRNLFFTVINILVLAYILWFLGPQIIYGVSAIVVTFVVYQIVAKILTSGIAGRFSNNVIFR